MVNSADQQFGFDGLLLLIGALAVGCACAFASGCAASVMVRQVPAREPSRPVWIFQGDRAYTPAQWEQRGK